MFFFDSSLPADGQDPIEGAAVPSRREARRLPRSLADTAVDRALRDVPLPDGLITRLGEIVYSARDESPDRLDWLGC